MPEHNDSAPPRGAFLLMILFLILVTGLWANVYLRLWFRG